MQIAICDDEKIFREQVESEVYDFFGKLDAACGNFEDGSQLIEAVKNGLRPDVIFLDIEMKDMDGMTAAGMLKELGLTIPVVFLTSHTELAMDGYEVCAFRFLAKPLNHEKMLQTLKDLKEILFGGKQILIRYEGEDVVIPVEQIVYLETRNNSVRMVLTEGEYLIRRKLTELERELNGITDGFIRIHRCYLVNLKHVKKHHPGEVIMTGEVTLPISRSQAEEFRNALFCYVRNNAR